MARIKLKLRELRDANVQFISLVDRAATRIPFRVVKRDSEETMDLTKIFKSDVSPAVTSVVVRDNQDPEVVKAVAEAIKSSGFSTEKVMKSDDGEALIYQQEASQGSQLVKLSDHVVLAVKGLNVPSGEFGELVAQNGFYTGFNTGMDVLSQKVNHLLFKSEDPKAASAAIKGLMNDFTDYITGLVQVLPAAAFKADFTVNEALNQIEIEKADKKKKPEEEEDSDKKDMPKDKKDMPCHKAETAFVEGGGGAKDDKAAPIPPNDVIEGSEEERKKKQLGGQDGKNSLVNDPGGSPDNHPAPEVGFSAVKWEESEAGKQMAALTQLVQSIAQKVDGITTEVTALSTQAKTTVEKQAELKNIVDGLAKKSDSLEEKFGSTVLATATTADAPARTEVAKQDTDPRSGCFDTAFLRKRR